jgi:hypothetical protein
MKKIIYFIGRRIGMCHKKLCADFFIVFNGAYKIAALSSRKTYLPAGICRWTKGRIEFFVYGRL